MRKILLILPICCLAILAFGQRDTIIVYKKGEFKVVENQYFNENGNLIKQIFMMEGDIPNTALTKEDRFERGLSDTDLMTVSGIVLDSVITYFDDGRVKNKRYFKTDDGITIEEKHHYKYGENNQLEKIKIEEYAFVSLSRFSYKRAEIIRIGNREKVKSENYKPKYSFLNGYDSSFTY